MEFGHVLVGLGWEKPPHLKEKYFKKTLTHMLILIQCLPFLVCLPELLQVLHLKGFAHIKPTTLAKENKDVEENLKISLAFNKLGLGPWLCCSLAL